MNSPLQSLTTDPTLHPPAMPNGSAHHAPTTPTGEAASHAPPGSAAGPKVLPSRSQKSRWGLLVALAALAVLAAGAVGAFVFFRTNTGPRADVVTFPVKRVELNVTVTEKGTLESADNRDVVCKVRAGNKAFATSINWVIDDGSLVKKDQLLMLLDDSDLQEKYRAQKIVVDTALATKIKADEDYLIQLKQNEIDIATAEKNLAIAELTLDEYTGFKADETLAGLGAAAGAPAMLVESGVYRQLLDDVTGRLRLVESEAEQNRERAAWAERMVKMRYMSAAQAQAERSRLDSSLETMRKTNTERSILQTFTRLKTLTQFRIDRDNYRKALDQAVKSAHGKEVQFESDKRTKTSVYLQEQEKLREIEDQLRECKIYAPQDGMVVYYKNESSRFSSNQQGLIEQGAQVKEGQKMLRIPDLKRMQVNTKVHEAMVSRINGDVRKSTGLFDKLRVSLLVNPHAFSRLLSQQEEALEVVRNAFRHHEYYVASRGDRATIRVDAFQDRPIRGHVRSVAAVASQGDFMASDVKLYQTYVMIDGLTTDPDPELDTSLTPDEIRAKVAEQREEAARGLKPDMTAEVTISVDRATDPVLAVPIQAVVGGTEMGAVRKVFVHTPAGYQERTITLGLFNEKMVEVKEAGDPAEGLKEGDVVVMNPKVLLGDKAKTRESVDTGGKGGDGAGAAGGKKGGKKKGGSGAGAPGGAKGP